MSSQSTRSPKAQHRSIGAHQQPTGFPGLHTARHAHDSRSMPADLSTDHTCEDRCHYCNGPETD